MKLVKWSRHRVKGDDMSYIDEEFRARLTCEGDIITFRNGKEYNVFYAVKFPSVKYDETFDGIAHFVGYRKSWKNGKQTRKGSKLVSLALPADTIVKHIGMFKQHSSTPIT